MIYKFWDMLRITWTITYYRPTWRNFVWDKPLIHGFVDFRQRVEYIWSGVIRGSEIIDLLVIWSTACRLFLPKVINSTPANLLQKITTHSLQGFSSSIKRCILDEYSELCSVANCYIFQRTWKTLSHFPLVFVHAKLTSVSKCSITPSLFSIVALLFDVHTICILLRHEAATVIIQCMTTGGIRDSGTSALTDVSSQLLLVTWS